MSLKSFVREPEISARLKAVLPTPKLLTKPPLRAPPLTKNWSMVGTAFDYLLRFYIQRLNPFSKATKWIAAEETFEKARVGKKVISPAKMLQTAKHHHREYIASGAVTDDLLASVLTLAQLDAMNRCLDLQWDNSYVAKLGKVDSLDITDLKALLALVRPEDFRTANICLLNPKFGAASKLVGGADCDLVLDTAIVDIKTTKQLSLSREYLNQLLGYALLARIAGIDGAPSQTIDSIGIYFSRFGYLWKMDLTSTINPAALSELTTWFEKKAREYNDLESAW